MGFFFAGDREAKPKAQQKQRLADIPINTLKQMGCRACPRDPAERDLGSPKLGATGRGADVLILTSSMEPEDDDDGEHASGKVGRELERVLGRGFFARSCSAMSVLQCWGETAPTASEVECCRPRGVREVEELRPLVVVTVGDEAMRWATGMTGADGTALTHRGQLFAARIGNHSCWVYPLMHPNYLFKKKAYGKSEYETIMELDAKRIAHLVDREMLAPPAIPPKASYDQGIEIITGREPGDMQRLEKALQELAGAPRSALDIETNRLRPFMHSDSLMLTAAVGTFERTVAFPIAHPDGWGSEAQVRRARSLFYDYVANSGRKACHNLGFEMEWIAHDGMEHLLRRTDWDDTMASAHTLNERPGTKSLGMQTRIYFGFDLKDQSRVDVRRLMDYPLPEVLRYNGMDTKWTNAVRDAHAPLLDAEPVLRDLYEEKVELAPTLVMTTVRGLPVDQRFADDAVRRLRAEAKEIEQKIRDDQDVKNYVRSRGSFSPTNPDHVLNLLKDMGRKEVNVLNKKEGTTSESTSEEVLLQIGNEVPACALILEHRSVSKLEGTYVLPTANGANVCPDGMIRSSYNSMVTVTDRLSADDPAVQNWPKRKHKWVRAMISVKELERLLGRRLWFVALDYGQIEFRVVGMASEDPNLVRYCWTGYDVHKAWAERLMVVYPEVVDWLLDEFDEPFQKASKKDGKEFDEDKWLLKTLRQEMKNKWVFPQLFGSSTRSCAAALHLPDDVTERLGGEFWDEFRVVKKWQDKVIAGYERNGYVETLNGARRRGVMTRNEAINMPIQGTAAAIVKRAMTALSVEAEVSGIEELQPRLNVHDDLSTIMADDTLEENILRTARIMCEHRYDFINVPLVVEASIGPNWADLEEIKVFRSDQLFNLRNPYS